MKAHYKSHIKAAFAIIGLVLLDQLTKHFLTGKKYMASCGGIEYVENYGAAFGILQGWNLPLVIVSLLMLALLAYFYFKEKNRTGKAAFVLIFAGTLGNLADRIFLGYVRDFIAVGSWPNFNVADSLNVIGVLILVYVMLRKK